MRRLRYIVAAAAIFAAAVAPLKAQACCAITGLEAKGQTAAAKVTATGQSFEFRVPDRRLFDSLKAGQPVYANFKDGQVSLDGKTACCSIGNTPVPGAVPRSTNAPGSVQIATPLPRTPTPKAVEDPQLGIDPTSLSFGNVNFGQTVSGSIKLTNSGQKKETVELPPEEGGVNAFRITSGAGIFSLEPGQSHGVTVSFQCGSSAEFFEVHRFVEYQGDPGTPLGHQQISFNARCVPRPSQVSINPAALDFGAVQIGTSASKSFAVKNTGSVVAHCTVIPSTVQPEFAVVSPLNFTLSPGASQMVTVKFTPGSQPRSYGSWLHVYDGGETGTAPHETSLTLSGSGKS